MKAYRVKIMGSNDHYLITERQKAALDRSLAGKGTIVHIGPDTIRTNSIKSISQTDVDLVGCPPYFVDAVKKEQAHMPSNDGPAYRKLPTAWVVLDDNFKIIATDISRPTIARVAEALSGDPNRRFYVADCHYRLGPNGEREFITQLNMVPEALKYCPDPDFPGYSPVTQRFLYGERQIERVPVK